MDIKKAEDIIDTMYQDKMSIREKQTKEGLEIDLSQDINFTELEKASVILLRNYLNLKRKSEEKDKQIDLMAEYWHCGLAICENCANYDEYKCKICIKQYFERKVEDERDKI